MATKVHYAPHIFFAKKSDSNSLYDLFVGIYHNCTFDTFLSPPILFNYYLYTPFPKAQHSVLELN